MHGGRAPQVAAAARTRLVEARAARQLLAEGYEPTLNPVEALLSLGAEATALKDVLRARVAEFADPEWVTSSNLGVDDASAVLRAYERSLDRCERVLGTILRLDLETWQTWIAEQQGNLLADMIEASPQIMGAGVQADEFKKVFAQQLRLCSP